MSSDVRLRLVAEADLPTFFEQQLDRVANHMAAFTAADPADHDAYMVRRGRNLGDATIIWRTILADGRVAGSVLSYEEAGAGRRRVAARGGRPIPHAAAHPAVLRPPGLQRRKEHTTMIWGYYPGMDWWMIVPSLIWLILIGAAVQAFAGTVSGLARAAW